MKKIVPVLFIIFMVFAYSCGEVKSFAVDFTEYYPLDVITQNVYAYDIYYDGKYDHKYYEYFELVEKDGAQYLYDYSYNEDYEMTSLDILGITDEGLIMVSSMSYDDEGDIESEYDPVNALMYPWNFSTDSKIEYGFSYSLYIDDYEQNATIAYKISRKLKDLISFKALGNTLDTIIVDSALSYTITLEDGRSGSASYSSYTYFSKGLGNSYTLVRGKDWKDEYKLVELIPVDEFMQNIE